MQAKRCRMRSGRRDMASSPGTSVKSTAAPKQPSANRPSPRRKVAAAAAVLQEQRARSTSYINLFAEWGRSATALQIAALVGAMAGAVTLSGLNLLSEFVPAFGAHAFPWTMAAFATLAGTYFGYGRRNIRQFQDTEAKQRIVQTQTAIQSELIDAAVKQLKQLRGLQTNDVLDKVQSGTLIDQVIRNTERNLQDVPGFGAGATAEVKPDAETVIIPSGQNPPSRSVT